MATDLNNLSNFRYNRLGGVDADRYLDGVIVPYTLSEMEIEELDSNEVIAEFNSTDYFMNSMWENIKAERDKRIQTGGYSVITSEGVKWFHSDTFSRSQQLGLYNLGQNIPEGLMWKTMDGSFVEMTPEIASAVFLSAVVSDNTIFTYAEQLRSQVQTSDNPEGVDIYSGWPLAFYET